MSNTIAYLDALKSSNGGISDYRASQFLGVTRSAVSKWRNGHGSMSMSHAEKVAKAIDADPDIVIIETILDRCKDDEEAAVWKRIIKRLSSTAIPALAALFVLFPSPDASAAPKIQTTETASNLYYVKFQTPPTPAPTSFRHRRN
ncbi:MAG: helix-turn-helix domain-containing protein [Zoogloeaceae bacterium]|jgi:transcriptional regulator with XRE-family HTH domain|nr:helix-turn-helix domain-containing protein [Zoogloeaceae bacterium]